MLCQYSTQSHTDAVQLAAVAIEALYRITQMHIQLNSNCGTVSVTKIFIADTQL